MSIKQKTYIYSTVRQLRYFAHPEFFSCGLKGLTVMFIYIYIKYLFHFKNCCKNYVVSTNAT